MDRLRKQATIFFLVIFTLVKISPEYYRLQYFPVLRQAGARPIHRLADENGQSLIRVNKGIVDKSDPSVVPSIKFSGVPFELYFGKVSSALTTESYSCLASTHQVVSPTIHLFNRVFRI